MELFSVYYLHRYAWAQVMTELGHAYL